MKFSIHHGRAMTFILITVALGKTMIAGIAGDVHFDDDFIDLCWRCNSACVLGQLPSG